MWHETNGTERDCLKIGRRLCLITPAKEKLRKNTNFLSNKKSNILLTKHAMWHLTINLQIPSSARWESEPSTVKDHKNTSSWVLNLSVCFSPTKYNIKAHIILITSNNNILWMHAIHCMFQMECNMLWLLVVELIDLLTAHRFECLQFFKVHFH